ncbi:MAG: hypothetical protein WDO24_06595 [Pseudomonadota bacterium]
MTSARKRELEAGEEARRLALETEKQRAHRHMVDSIETEIDRELPKITGLAGQMSGAAGRMVEVSHRTSDECAVVRDSAALAAQNANQVAAPLHNCRSRSARSRRGSATPRPRPRARSARSRRS